jgi:hypothetical protein
MATGQTKGPRTSLLTVVNLMLQSHARGAERRRAVTKEEMEEHKEVDVEDVVKLKKVGEEVLSTRRWAQGGQAWTTED